MPACLAEKPLVRRNRQYPTKSSSNNTFGGGATIITPFIVVALLKSYGIAGVLSLIIGLLIVQIFVVSFFGVEPRKRRLEELDSSIPRSHFSENPALASVAKK